MFYKKSLDGYRKICFEYRFSGDPEGWELPGKTRGDLGVLVKLAGQIITLS